MSSQNAPAPPTEGNGTVKKVAKKSATVIIVIVIIVVVVVIIVIGLVVYFFVIRKKSTNNNNNTPVSGSLNDPCSASQACLFLFTCENSVCKSITGGPCQDNTDCNTSPFTQTCSNNQCKRVNGQTCSEANNCASGVCTSGSCVSCTNTSQCVTGLTCDIPTGVCH
jgi:hypothetical protein